MLDKSKLYGTELPVGPRLKKLLDAGMNGNLLWEEDYPDQEKATRDGKGEFYHNRLWIETASMKDVFDLWLRGHSLIGYAGTLLYAVDCFKKVYEK